MKKITITIARQYGSGGRTVGIRLANELGIHYYDKELTKLASEQSGISESLFLETDERFRKKGFLKTPIHVYNSEIIGPDSPEYTSPDNLFNLQARCIKELAENEPCIIVGRCADFVLRDYDNVLSVFVHAPQWFLMEQAGKKHSMSEKELEKYIAKIDKDRADYYKAHTGREWTDARNYDLCLDSSKLGFERCVDEIIAYMNVRFK